MSFPGPVGRPWRLAEAGIAPSVRTVGDSYDDALAESVTGLFKTEVIEQLGPWKNLQDVEWETMHWVDGYNTERRHSAIGYMTPAEAELRHIGPPETIGMVASTVERNTLR